MKAEELQLNDYVYFDESDKVCQIKGIRTDTDSPAALTSVNDVWYTVESLRAIPLNPKILEMNGFDVSDKEVMRYNFKENGKKYHFSLRQMYDKDGTPHGFCFYAFNVLTVIDYVHQLQHALRLCGIDKEIIC